MPLAQLGVARATTQQIENQGIKQKRKTKMETPRTLMTAPRAAPAKKQYDLLTIDRTGDQSLT